MPQVVGLRCPHCAAALPAEVGATSVKCAYCGTTSLLQRGGTIAASNTASAPPTGAGLKLGCGAAILLGAGMAFFLLRSSPVGPPPTVEPSASLPVAVPITPPPAITTPTPTAPPPRIIKRIDTTRRPLLVDVNRDGKSDVVAIAQLAEGDRSWPAYVALDSGTGALLWTIDIADDDRRNIYAAVAHDRLLLLTDKGQLHGHDLRTGAAQWSTALGDKGSTMCASKTPDALEIPTIDERVLAVDVRTGKQTPVTKPGACAPLPTDHVPRDLGPSDRTDARAPAGTVAIRCGGASVYTSAGLTKVPDQCRTRSKIAVDDLDGLVAHSLWQHPGGWLVLGVRKPGTYVPMLGNIDASKKLAWKAEVPEGNPLLADQGGPDPALLLRDRVIVGWTAKDQPAHLTAFALAGGERLWSIDAPGGKRVQRAAVADEMVFLYSEGLVHIMNPADGALVRTLGGAE